MIELKTGRMVFCRKWNVSSKQLFIHPSIMYTLYSANCSLVMSHYTRELSPKVKLVILSNDMALFLHATAGVILRKVIISAEVLLLLRTKNSCSTLEFFTTILHLPKYRRTSQMNCCLAWRSKLP